MAVANADYTFEFVDVGGYGRQSDGGTWKACALGRALNDGTLALPEPRTLNGSSESFPYVFVADAAFPHSVNLLRPYPGFAKQTMTGEQRIFNYRYAHFHSSHNLKCMRQFIMTYYLLPITKFLTCFFPRLSRARRVVENAFGILAMKWRIFIGPMNLQPKNAIATVLACTALHNFVLRESAASGGSAITPGMVDTEKEDGTVEPGSWRRELQDTIALQKLTGNRATKAALRTREIFTAYFNVGPGIVPWQDGLIFGKSV